MTSLGCYTVQNFIESSLMFQQVYRLRGRNFLRLSEWHSRSIDSIDLCC